MEELSRLNNAFPKRGFVPKARHLLMYTLRYANGSHAKYNRPLCQECFDLQKQGSMKKDIDRGTLVIKCPYKHSLPLSNLIP